MSSNTTAKRRVLAMIPARIGSERLRLKNLALLGGTPLISWAIKAARAAEVFERIVINADHEVFDAVAEREGVEFYLRPKTLGTSATTSDDVVYDFISHHAADYVAWVNPTSPLQAGAEIAQVVNYCLQYDYDTVMTVRPNNVHCVFNGLPMNYDRASQFARTQDLSPVYSFVYSVMVWDCMQFVRRYETLGGAALLGEKIGYYEVSRDAAVIIKTVDDLMFADALRRSRDEQEKYMLEYDPLAETIKEGN